MFAITKQSSAGGRPSWAELNADEQTGAVWVTGYATRGEAEARMVEMVPADKDPWVYAGLRVEETWRDIVVV